jgi:hypothetical protein
VQSLIVLDFLTNDFAPRLAQILSDEIVHDQFQRLPVFCGDLLK